jgi:hypothetical protein
VNIQKILTCLGFCPSKESAKNFGGKNMYIESNSNKWKPYRRFLSYTGVLLVFTGLAPFYFEDTSVTGVTDTIILHSRIGVTCFLLGITLICIGVLFPRIADMLRKTGVYDLVP